MNESRIYPHICSEYYDLNNVPTRTSSSLNLFHCNIRSLKKNIDRLYSCISNVDTSFSVLGITETWLNNNEKLLPIHGLSGYNFVGKGRRNRPGGGVGLFIKDTLKYKIRDDLNVFVDSVELFCIELYSDSNVIIGVLYRPPGQPILAFKDSVETILFKIANERKSCFMMGDFNINHCNQDDTNSKDFIQYMNSYAFFPVISKPTRVTTESSSLLDNIFVNNPCNIDVSGIVTYPVSDHMPIFLISNVTLHTQNVNEPCSSLVRHINESNILLFYEELTVINWDDIIHNLTNDVNLLYDIFSTKFCSLYNTCFPVVLTKGNNRTKMNPWFDKNLRKLCRKKNVYYRKFVKNPTLYREAAYKKQRNIVNDAIRKAKRDFYGKKFLGVKNDLKGTWNVINGILKYKSKIDSPLLVKDNKSVSNSVEVSELFNEYFVSVGENIAKSVPSSVKSPSDFLIGDFPNSFFFTPITNSDVINATLSLKDGKSPGHDDISTMVLKKCIHIIAPVLTHIFNISLQTGCFPEKLKIAKVLPIYKKGDKSQCENYRPISLLSIFGKIFEKLVYAKFMFFIDKYDILYNKQFGFRSGHSTYMALLEFINNLNTAFEAGHVGVGIFLDLSKAFDTLNHSILLQKLYFYGIRGISLEWIKSYLSNRQQFVCIDGNSSTFLRITSGVPQGSILGPLLFLLYINDIQNVSSNLSSVVFADDTNVFISGRNATQITSIITTEIPKLEQWFLSNKLLVNMKKTNCIVFKQKNKRIADDIADVVINNQKVLRVSCTSFLGVMLDEHLNWAPHIDDVLHKISCATGVIYRIRHLLSLRILLYIYNATILPHLTYCTMIWGQCAKSLLNRVFTLQKRSLRAITNSHPSTPSQPLFQKLQLLTVFDICKLQTASFMYMYTHKLLPSVFDDMFKYTRDIHLYNTRQTGNLYLPLLRYVTSQRSVKYQGVHVWNSVPEEMRLCPSLASFKRRYKIYLLNSYN